jgi:heme/copper-type cytochrome/quinol oxidase subunit 3
VTAVQHTPFQLAPAPEPRRPRVLLVGAGLAATAAAMAVLTLVGIYLQLRGQTLAKGNPWIPEGSTIPLTPGSMGMVSLAMSGVTMAWCVYSLRNSDRTNAYLALAVTVILGVAYVTDIVYLYSQMHLAIAATPQAVLIYAITGAHIAMVAGGLLFALVMGFQALGGQLTGRDADGMNAAALFWYVTIAVYSVIWYAVFITK